MFVQTSKNILGQLVDVSHNLLKIRLIKFEKSALSLPFSQFYAHHF